MVNRTIDDCYVRAIRKALNRSCHREYLHSKKDILVLSEPLQDDGGTQSIGSVFIVDVNSRAEAKAFLEGDPFSSTGHYTDEKIIRMRKGMWNPAVMERA